MKTLASCLLVAALFFACDGRQVVDCYDAKDDSETQVCSDLLWEKLPISIVQPDELQAEAMDVINDYFGEEVFIAGEVAGIKISVDSDEHRFPDLAVAMTAVFCEPDQGAIKKARIAFRASKYGSDKTVNTAIHELFHAMGYRQHEPGIMCRTNADFDSDPVAMIAQSAGLLEFLKDAYGLAGVHDRQPIFN